MYSKHDPKYQTLPPNTKFNKNGLDLIPHPGRGVGPGLRKDVALNRGCAMDDSCLGMRDVSSPSGTPTIDSPPEDTSLRILSSESGLGSSISSGCSFQSNSINLMSGKQEDGREGELLRAKGIPVTISLNSSSKAQQVPTQQWQLSSLNTPAEKGSSDHSLHPVPSSSSFSSSSQQNTLDCTSASDHITSNNNDWQKSRRRPVVVDEDMERQLSAPDCDVIELTQKHFPVETRKNVTSQRGALSHREAIVKPATGKSSPVKCHDGEEESDSLSSALSCDVTDDSCSWSQVPRLEKVVVVEKTIESLNVKQKDNHDQKVPSTNVESNRKSGLKNHKVSGLTRRVSFDPLALLLDAALEGELELVKKTASQVLLNLSE